MTVEKTEFTHNLAILGLVLIGYTLLWVVYPHHLIMSDPWAYSKLAHTISEGTFLAENPDNIFVHRLGATLPTGLAYKIFDVSIYSTNLSPLIAALIILSTIWLALPTLAARLTGVALCATNVTFFQMSVNLYPDIIAAAFMGVSVLILVKRDEYLTRKTAWIYPAFGIACMFLAFLAKLSAYWVLPVWLIVISADMRAGHHALIRKFYFPALFTGLLLGILYLLFNFIAWGNPLVRFTNVSGVVEAGLWAIDGPNATDALTRRLTVDALSFLLQHYGIVLVPALLALPFIPKNMKVWSYYSVITILFFWFGTTSFTSYQPMPLVNRMPLPSLPGLCILAAYFVTQIKLPDINHRKTLNSAFAIAIVVTSVYFFNSYLSTWKNFRWFEHEAVELIRSDVQANTSQKFLVISLESRSVSSLEFYFQYKYPENLKLVAAADLEKNYNIQQIDAFDKIYIYQNRSMASFLSRAYGQNFYDLSHITKGTKKLYDAGGITVNVDVR